MSKGEHGVYERVTLVMEKGERELSQAYYWAGNILSDHLVDVPGAEIPNSRHLPGMSLVISDDAGDLVLSGEITDVGAENGLGGATTVIVGENDAL